VKYLLVLVTLLLIVAPAVPVAAQEPETPMVDERLVEPLQTLEQVVDADGQAYSDLLRAMEVDVRLASLPPGHLARYSLRARTITLTDRLLGEDANAIAAVVVHEFQHVRDKDLIARGEASYDCLDLEVRAFEAQSRVWRTLRPDLPAATPIERELSGAARIYERGGTDGLRAAVARVPFYQQECPAS
jgi:hypothetical protein